MKRLKTKCPHDWVWSGGCRDCGASKAQIQGFAVKPAMARKVKGLKQLVLEALGSAEEYSDEDGDIDLDRLASVVAAFLGKHHVKTRKQWEKKVEEERARHVALPNPAGVRPPRPKSQLVLRGPEPEAR